MLSNTTCSLCIAALGVAVACKDDDDQGRLWAAATLVVCGACQGGVQAWAAGGRWAVCNLARKIFLVTFT